MDTQYRRKNITLPNELLTRFEKRCKRMGMRVSSRIAVLIKNDLEVRA